MSYLRYYDNSVIEYFKTIYIETPEEVKIPQIAFALPSRQGIKLQTSDNKTPLFPFISIIRTGLTPNNETRIVKNKITRPFLLNINKEMNLYEGAEFMPYNLNYQVDYFSLIQEQFNILTEKILFKLHKKHFIKTMIDFSNHNASVNGYISNVSFVDSTSYAEVPDNSSRMFHGTINFILETFLIDPNYATKSVLTINEEIIDWETESEF